jgi:hypothetical protein
LGVWRLCERLGDPPPWWEQPNLVLEGDEEFWSGPHRLEPNRMLNAVLLPDNVGSTQPAELGNRRLPESCRFMTSRVAG